MAWGLDPTVTVAVAYCARTDSGFIAARTNPPTARNDSARLKFPKRLRPNSSEAANELCHAASMEERSYSENSLVNNIAVMISPEFSSHFQRRMGRFPASQLQTVPP
jgi:hypothetical protein